jgi:cytidylate kinase
MRADGVNVLMEGRAQTLNYVRTPHRFELTLSEPLIIGMRRAAQRMMGQALEKLQDKAEAKHNEVRDTLFQALASMESPDASPALTKTLLDAADDTTSNAIISAFQGNQVFEVFAKKEMEEILQRDKEDDDKLAAGIVKAVAKGVIPKDPPVEPTCVIDVLGKSADAVASAIVEKLGDAPKVGCVLVLQGLSGTGKGTTVAKLQGLLPRAVCWSNGNVFRALTLLAVGHCEQKGIPFSSDVLTPGLLQEFVGCLTFGKFNGKWDIQIQVAGSEKAFVSEVANTALKEPRVGKNIPTVAEVTQGEVIKFAAGAAEAMRQDGMNVLMEGRAQTLDYVRTPHRFQLTLTEPIIIGKRRAAQRMIGKAAEVLKGAGQPSPEDIRGALQEALAGMA